EAIEGPLLGGGILAWGPDRPALEGPVHSLVGAILLRPARMDALVLDAEAHPPDIELGEAVDAGGGEGHPIVGPNGPRQAIGPEGPLEERASRQAMRGREPVAGEQVPGMQVRDGERVAVEPVS